MESYFTVSFLSVVVFDAAVSFFDVDVVFFFDVDVVFDAVVFFDFVAFNVNAELFALVSASVPSNPINATVGLYGSAEIT